LYKNRRQLDSYWLLDSAYEGRYVIARFKISGPAPTNSISINAEVTMGNPNEYLYPWIQGLDQHCFDEQKIVEAMSTVNGGNIDMTKKENADLALLIVRHALGKSDGKELEALYFPSAITEVTVIKAVPEGHLCQAACSDRRHDFTFLVEHAVSDKILKDVAKNHTGGFAKILQSALRERNPYGYTDADYPQPDPNVRRPPCAKFLLVQNDLRHLLTA
jgi:hypothetical protein